MTPLSVRDVTVRFGGNVALDQVNLTAQAGQVTGLIGPNGAGKTTLFNVISGLLTPQRGQVRIADRPVTHLPPYRRAHLGLARTFQRLELFGLLTVRENVELAISVRRRERRPAAVGAGNEANRLLARVGLAELADVRADELSTGRARLVELARALGTRPDVLLLDEPASGQDEEETERFAGLLTDIAAEGVAVVLVEHDVPLVMKVCDVIHVLDFGAMLAVGSAEDIKGNQAVLDAYLGATVTPAAPVEPGGSTP